MQSFADPSDVRSLQQAIGQYGMYRYILARTDPDRALYLAVHSEVYDGILSEQLGQAS